MRQKVLILPIDIKSREFDARLLHAAIAIQHGWTVYTGSKTLINRAIWRLPRGVYLFSTMAPGRLFMARMLKRLGFAAIGWDEEGLIYADRDLYLAQRISEKTMALMGSVHAWGKAHARDLAAPAAAAGQEVHVSGNPRLDLLKPRLRGLYEDERRRISERFGRFVLVATNFSWANPHVVTEDKTKDSDAFRAEGAKSYVAYQRRMKAAFVEAIDAIAPTLDARIVIRPHPVENAEAWTALAEKHANVVVERSGAIIPWLLAAAALVHSNSTTGVEARVLGRPVVAFVPFQAPRHESPLPNGVSIRAASAADLGETLRRILAGDVPDTRAQDALLSEHLHMSEGLCAEYFVEEAERLWRAAPRPSPFAPLLRAYLVARHLHKSLRIHHPRDIHRRNIYPDTPLSEVTQRLRRIIEVLGEPIDFSARELAPNIYRLEPMET